MTTALKYSGNFYHVKLHHTPWTHQEGLALKWFMTSLYGHAHTHPAVKENHDAGHNKTERSFILCFPQRDLGWLTHGWWSKMNRNAMAIQCWTALGKPFLRTAMLTWQFVSGSLSIQIEKQTKTIIPNIQRSSTITTTKLLWLEHINTLDT